MPQSNQFCPLDKVRDSPWRGGGWKPGDFLANTTSHEGSILLYVLFLSSFLILFFVSFQWEIEKTLERTEDSETVTRDISALQDALALLKSTPSEKQAIDGNPYLSLISMSRSGNVFSGSLGWSYDSREYWITSTGWATDIGLSIVSWGPVSYRLAAFDSGSESSAAIVSSGMTAADSTIPLSPSLNQHILVIESLGGYGQYALDAGSATILPQSSAYRLERDINGYKKDEWLYDIIHFIPKTRAGIDYQKMGMYLKE